MTDHRVREGSRHLARRPAWDRDVTARPAWHYDREGNKTECWQCSTCGFVYLTEHGANACGCKYGERRKGAKRAQTSGR